MVQAQTRQPLSAGRASVGRAADDQLGGAVSLILAMMPVVRTIKARAGTCQMHGMSITPRHMQVLMQVFLVGHVTVSELADQVRLSLASTSLIVSQLALVGLLERHEDPQDHRRTVVSPGPDYDQFVTDVLVQHFAPLMKALSALGGEDRANLNRLAHLLSSKLIEMLDEGL
ncbi:MAG: MarR family winged helix-turn-helix transcriptional regulator [Ferrimicrobium sp.]|uniref:MarR family winged helix-turn-helix transcriptional regulator n=1 Tax=Ferrimicrobium acidiphilum TaxID=121039 RepID=A0ABV3Y1W4_9ACTN|nr:MarR family winged helix-turn-helix transcriptional regulator [Ferrimicrobium sp.]MCL5972976.1 MarR family winged helix-turn-helix transcriptional regulator [Actinomycetota bacterium]